MTPSEWLDLFEARAPTLRARGIASVEIAGDRAIVRFAPPFGVIEGPTASAPPAAATPEPEPDPDDEADPLDDEATFGGPVPGYTLDEDAG